MRGPREETPLTAPADDAAARLAAARRLLDSAPADAAVLARGLLAQAPDAPEPRLLLGAALRRIGLVEEALAMLGPLAAAQPRAWGVRHEHGLALAAAGQLDAAAVEQAAAVAANPGSAAARGLAATLHRLGRDAEALAALGPADGASGLRAAIRLQLGDAEGASADYAAALAETPGDARLWHASGHAHRAAGRQAEAVAAYRRALVLDPAWSEPWWSLANLKAGALDTADVSAMRAALATASDGTKAWLDMALGKALEDAGDFAASFAHYAAGNAARRAAEPHDAGAARDFVRRTTALFTPAFLAAREGTGAPSDAPIFVVGMPRSGSTLVEQILASHSAVEGASELPDLPALARGLGGRYPEVLGDLPPLAFAALGRAYLERTAVRRRLVRPHFVDKFPGNVLHAGLIHLALPNARIVDVRRHPLATCVSLYKQAFAAGQAYSYDLGDLGRAYADYVALTAHFDRVLPGRIVRVAYEALVEDPEAEVRRLLDRLGLGFEPGCLRFFETARVVRTPSSEQVRRPIFRDGLGQWRHYEPWLGPLKRALGPLASDG